MVLTLLTTPLAVPQGAVVQLDPNAPDLRDPRLDGWVSETFNEDIGTALKPLKEALKEGLPSPDSETTVEHSEAATNGVAPEMDWGPPLRSATTTFPALDQLTVIRDTPSFTTRRFSAMGSQLGNPGKDLGPLVTFLRGPLTHGAHVTLKVVGVEAPDQNAGSGSPGVRWKADLLFEVGGHDGDVGWHAALEATSHWTRAEGDLTLDLLTGHTFESTELRIPGGQLFEDVTAAVLTGERVWEEQLQVGQDHWARTIEEKLGMGLYKHSGIAVGDANGDGLEDLYVAQPAGLPNLLLLKDSDGNLRDHAPAAGVDWLDHTSSALLVDLDGDGDSDLVATVAGTIVIQENLGVPKGSSASSPLFKTLRTLTSNDTDLYGLSAVDVDLDGDLDLYVTADFANKRRDGSTGERARFDYVDANDGGRNVLWRNNGDFQFSDATAELGLDVRNQRHSLAATWRDIDRDGDVDLYVANDYGHNCLYINHSDQKERGDEPLFRECAAEYGVEDRGSGMSIDVGDPNRDGRLDLLVANMWSSAGRRVVPQAGFGAASSAEERAQFSRFAKGNTLYLAEPAAEGGVSAHTSFTEASRGLNIERGRWAWATPFVDLDGDGWEDMLVGNGYVTSSNSGDL